MSRGAATRALAVRPQRSTLHRTRAVLAAAAAAAAAALAGCTTVGPDYQRPGVALPAAFDGAAATEADAVPARWWTLFGDPVLEQLVDDALARNVDLRAAAARVDETEAVLEQARAAMFPQVDLQGSASRTRASTVGAIPLPSTAPVVQNANRLVLSTTFEIDFWGRLRRADEAARAQALGSRHARDVVATTLAGATAQAYFALRALEAQAAAVDATVTAREESLALARRRAAGGLSSDLDVQQATAALADARLQGRELQRQRALLEHQLAVLAGSPGAKVRAGSFAALPVPPTPPAGLPSSLVERRPDVRQAEQALATATALIGVARAAQYPTFSLTGFLGGQSADLTDILSSGGRVGSIGASVLWPVLDAGRYAARTREAEARAAQAAAAYEKSLQVAWREVADALANVRAAADAEADTTARLAAARESVRITRIRYDAGYSAYLEVLDAQRTSNAAELAAIQNRQARLAASVELMKALGGGWRPVEPNEPRP
jgi:multidrug efflux system outer membrane protein